jgi:hypothetical protein
MRSYNCARVYVGHYIGGGTNEYEREIDCKYEVLQGSVVTKKLRPIKVRWTTSEGQVSTLQTLAIYPRTEVAVVNISNSRGSHQIRLMKAQKGVKSIIFKASL